MVSIAPINALINYKNNVQTANYQAMPARSLKADTFERVAISPISFSGLGNRVKISPSLLAADFSNLGAAIERIRQAGADWVHIDVMDGHSVPNVSFGEPVIKSLLQHKGTLLFDVHLMVTNPESHIKSMRECGADIITVEYDKIVGKALDVIYQIKATGAKASIAINPDTEVEEIRHLLPYLDQVLVMSVTPGAGGQGFMHGSLDKIRKIRALAGPKLTIQVDGGINDKTAKLCRDAGADSLVAGTYFFKHENPHDAVTLLRGEENKD